MKIKTVIYPFAFIGAFFLLSSSCTKDEASSSSILKKDPIITWENPADIAFGTLLSEAQLNATCNVSGTFVYTPEIGTKLNEGANQDLKVDFTPSDLDFYNTASNTVKINVIHGGLIFNPDKTYGIVTDIDGNVYKTIVIGTQTWMAENLRTTKYSNGEAIPEVTDKTAWNKLITGAYCNLDNTTDSNFIATYGRLYNWYAAADSQNIAPIGWHVPTIDEWTLLITYLESQDNVGGRLKETGTSHWQTPNTGATNETGFTAVPGGLRNDSAQFYPISYSGSWWLSSKGDWGPTIAWGWFLSYNDGHSPGYGGFLRHDGFSVRCLKD